MSLKSLIAGVLALGTATVADATVILTSNFDSLALSTGSYTTVSSIEGWTSTTNGIEIQNHAAGAPFSSPNLVELDTFANSSMFHTLSEGTYLVSYYYSPRPAIGAASNGITLSIGSTALDTVTGTGGSDTMWTLRSVKFATTGGALTFAATGTSDSLGGYLDNITIAAVPDASTWILMIAGFGMVGIAARRRALHTVVA
ncbi:MULTISPECIES: PEP-CTERM sorting domain-containing protein [Sphingosinicellaceae]|uniref:PEP-CTERM sorting domain-containing protein n=1 Tax=Sphingosinicellaceae TaxID=2820280 RepID=UPI001D023C39|nr:MULTISPECIES: PEP-CTERM sorting domain-containing protein [Polymorphobacter]